MAEINVERKQSRTGVWVAAALIVLVLVVWWMLRSDRADDMLGAVTDSSAAVAPAAGAATDSAAPAVQAFLSWSENRADSAMALDHQYTVTGIRHLTEALGAIAGQAQAARVREDLALLRSRADTLQRNPTSTQHADQARVMFRSLSGLMAAMQQERFPDLADEVKAVEDAAEAVRADRLLLDQRTQVRNFFDRSAVVVRQMRGQR